MSSVLFPSLLPCTRPPSAFPLFPASHQRFFLDHRHDPNSRDQQGNLTSLASPVAALSGKQPPRLLVHRRNSRLATRQGAELVAWVEGDGGGHGSPPTEETEGGGVLPSDKAFGIIGCVSENGGLRGQEDGGVGNFTERNGSPPTKDEESRVPREGLSYLQKESRMLSANLERDNLSGEPADEVLDEMHTKEREVLAIFPKQKSRFPTEEDSQLSKTSKRSSRLHVDELVRRIMSLPVEERAKVLDLFAYDDRLLTVSDYNDILAALVKAEEFESALKLFSELPSRGVPPDSWSFSLMVRCMCKMNVPDEARRVLDDMINSGFRPNVVTFTILIDCLCKRGRMQNAFEVFEIMKGVGCEPTIRTYNCLINGLCYVGRIEEACQLLNKITKSSNTPDIYTFTLVIDGFCKVGLSDEAMKLLKEALEMDLTPTIVTYNALLNGYCKEARPLEGLLLLEEMERRDCIPDFISYNILLQGLVVCGEISEALKIYKKMSEAGFQVQERMMNTLLRGLCRHSLSNGEPLTEAKEIFKKIMETEYSISPYTYCLMVQALANGGEINEALAHLLEMVRTGFSPRMMTYNIVLRVLCEEGRVDDALHVLVVMIKRDTIPSRFSFSVLLDEFSQQGRHFDALGIYAAALKRGMNFFQKRRKYGEDEREPLASVQEEKLNFC